MGPSLGGNLRYAEHLVFGCQHGYTWVLTLNKERLNFGLELGMIKFEQDIVPAWNSYLF
jgi:hypothetical protein